MDKKSKIQTSMIEISLVPDVKKELLIAQRLRNQVSIISIIVTASILTVGLIVVMFVYIYQHLKLDSLDKEGNRLVEYISNIEGSNQTLTIQNQLIKIDQVHQQKPMTSRIFLLMLHIVETNKLPITISGLTLNVHNNQIVIDGSTEKGFVALEELMKTIEDTKIEYKTSQPIDVNQTETEDQSDQASAEEEQEVEVEKLPITEKVSLLANPSFNREDGKQILRFKIGFVIEETFFKNIVNRKINLFGSDQKDVTDSSLSIPENIFSKNIQPETETNSAQEVNQIINQGENDG